MQRKESPITHSFITMLTIQSEALIDSHCSLYWLVGGQWLHVTCEVPGTTDQHTPRTTAMDSHCQICMLRSSSQGQDINSVIDCASRHLQKPPPKVCCVVLSPNTLPVHRAPWLQWGSVAAGLGSRQPPPPLGAAQKPARQQGEPCRAWGEPGVERRCTGRGRGSAGAHFWRCQELRWAAPAGACVGSGQGLGGGGSRWRPREFDLRPH